jgi:hypothetical protein
MVAASDLGTVLASTAAAVFFSATPVSPSLWLDLEVDSASPCHADGVAAAIRGLRPDLVVKIGQRTSASDLQVLFVERNGSLSLSILGPGKPLNRDLPPASASCADASQTAALIVDRYLDEFYATGAEAQAASTSAGEGPRLSLQLGPSLVQMPTGLSLSISPGLILELDLRLGLAWFSLGGEANLPSNGIVAQGLDGSYHVQPAAAWIAAGIALPLGPGRLVLQASLGLDLLWVGIQSSLHQETPSNRADPYAGLVGAYLLDLPSHFSAGLRFEERFVPSPSVFAVEGVANSTSVTARRFTADLALLAGYTFL